MKKKPLYVTTPSLGPLEQFRKELETVWERGFLTNNGPLVRRLEAELAAYMGVDYFVSLNNGTIALQIPLKAWGCKGEIITTPFSWIATCSSILWENCRPVFVDIDPKTFNLDPQKIEDAVTHRTCGIMPVHVFSNPCAIEDIDTIAKKHKLKIIYDGAHASCVNYKGKSVLRYGDACSLSFHATKLFNTAEGGALVTEDEELYEQFKRIRFFGHNDEKDIIEDGCNAKMTEIHAALGLVNLTILDEVRARRKEIFEIYYAQLSSYDFISWQDFDRDAYNYSYVPVVFDSEERLKSIHQQLLAENIIARRYFYPCLNTIAAVSPYQAMPIAEDISKRILCLPSHQRVTDEQIHDICKLIINNKP